VRFAIDASTVYNKLSALLSDVKVSTPVLPAPDREVERSGAVL
jgi:hypothetical protein